MKTIDMTSCRRQRNGQIIPANLPLVILPLLLLVCLSPSSVSAQNITTASPVFIGNLRSCAHDLEGKVSVLNAKQVQIDDFTYTYVPGTEAYWHVMPMWSISINTNQSLTMPDESESCGFLKKSYQNETIILTIPFNLTVQMVKSIGLFSYNECSNFGNVYFLDKAHLLHTPEMMVLPPGVNADMVTKPCERPIEEDCNWIWTKDKEFIGKCVGLGYGVSVDGGAPHLSATGVLVVLLPVSLLALLFNSGSSSPAPF